jgi:signal transduction histidine kinase
LIDNAVKYTDSGSIYILASETIENLIIEVSDTGIGMSIEQIKYYENLQINVENEKLLLQKYGIGLNLVLQLLNIINGTISFNSINNKGTSVKISIKK